MVVTVSCSAGKSESSMTKTYVLSVEEIEGKALSDGEFVPKNPKIDEKKGGSGMREMNCRKIQENKDGSTMIETLVAFLVVVLVILMFSKVVSVSSQVLNRTRQIMKENEAFNAEYYKLDSSGKGTRRTPVKSDVVLLKQMRTGKNRRRNISW